jgi:streptogramin lyase
MPTKKHGINKSVFALVALMACCHGASAAKIITIAGTGEAGTKDGPAVDAQLNNPFGVVRGPDGKLWFCEYDGHTVRRINSDGTIVTVVGNGKEGYSGDGGPALAASLNKPHEIRFDSTGRLYIADMANHAIRRVDLKSEIITTIAGTGTSGFSGDGGLATLAQLNQPHSIQFGPDGRLFICDIGNHRVRVVDMETGFIETFAGNGKWGPTPDGALYNNIMLNGPRTLDFDQQGRLWLALREGNQVFVFDLEAGTIHHVAGTGKKGFTGNGGSAKHATLSGPKGISVAPNGNVYLADTESHSVRMINTKTGNIELIAGTGSKNDGPDADGDPLNCGLARPHGVFVDADGSIFIGDSENHRIRLVRP